MPIHKPTKADLQASAGKTIPDVIGPGLKVLFCGINPGLYSGYTGYHFARPGNRFWPALYASGFTERLLAPSENQVLLASGCGITNLVERSTATAAELTREELTAGAKRLAEKAERYRPRVIAVLGVTAYREAFESPKAQLGEQPDKIGPSLVWVLPNPSGLNTHVTPTKLAQMLRQFRIEIEQRTSNVG